MALEFVSGFLASSLLQEVMERIRASVADEINLAMNSDVEEELKQLEASYVKAQSNLDKIEGWDLITSKPHQNWVADVRRACYDTEDFAQHLKFEIMILNKGDHNNFLRSYWTKWGVSRKIRDLQRNLDRLANGFVSCCVTNIGSRGHSAPPNKELLIVPKDDESFGRKRDKDQIIAALLSPTSSILVIVGMFGIGKTMLAQVVKNDPRIQLKFDHKLWVSVSGEFDLRKALWSMIQELCSTISPSFPEQQYVKKFQDLCEGRKVLVILDDLRNFSKQQDWEDFQSILLKSSSNSMMFSVIITTRNPNVAIVVDSLTTIPPVSHHHLQRMSDEDCQSLILQRKKAATSNYQSSKRKHHGRSTLEVTALQISEKFCKGLPLVANIIAHHLTSEPEDQWPRMLSKHLWELPEFKEQVFPKFRLNYPDLSIFAKNCFPYFSLFPENYNFKKDELVRLWLAEGFIKPQVVGFQHGEYPGLEELGNYYFDEVLSQSILQIYDIFTQEPNMYRMHEFIRRYAQYIGSDMYVVLDQQFFGTSSPSTTDFAGSSGSIIPWYANSMMASTNVTTWYKTARHVSLLCSNIPPQTWKDIEKCDGLRTILSPHEHTHIGRICYTLFLKLQSLRVLDLSGSDITELPESMGKLKHLRFLDVSKTDIEELPASTSELYGLQFLRLDDCPLLLQLPKDIKNLTCLLHLDVDIKGLIGMPPDIGKLINLRTLRAFIVGSKRGYRVTELKHMNYLQGSICLTNVENVKDAVEAREAQLMNKPFLKRVEFEWNRYSTNVSFARNIFTGFEPHENLEELQITGYYGAQFPSWLSSSECKLTSIHLLRCDRLSILPPLGQPQHLKTLHIEEIHSVENIDHQFLGNGVLGGFPSLESLKFQDMMSLKKWEGLQANQMPCLRDLVITDCPNLISLPPLNLLTSLVNLEISYCPLLQGLPVEGLPLSLATLILVKCDLLKQSCLPEQGVDWEKIISVPKVFVDFVQLPTDARES